jgi:hypothetical protein
LGITFHTDSDYFGTEAKQQGPSLKGNKRGKRAKAGEQEGGAKETQAEAAKE